VALAAAVALGLLAALAHLNPAQREVHYLAEGARFGRGPHATVECQPNEVFVDELISMIDQLRDAATEEQWSIDWNQFNSLTQQGKQAQEKRDFAGAVRQYASALRFMMNELRNQRAKVKTGASSGKNDKR
jgi:hypothetical protein